MRVVFFLSLFVLVAGAEESGEKKAGENGRQKNKQRKRILQKINTSWYAPEREGLEAFTGGLRIQSEPRQDQSAQTLLRFYWKKGGFQRVVLGEDKGSVPQQEGRFSRLRRLVNFFVQEPFRIEDLIEIKREKNRIRIKMNEGGRTVIYGFSEKYRPVFKIVPFRKGRIHYDLKTDRRNQRYYVREYRGKLLSGKRDIRGDMVFRTSVSHEERSLDQQKILMGTSVTWSIKRTENNEVRWQKKQTYELVDLKLNPDTSDW